MLYDTRVCCLCHASVPCFFLQHCLAEEAVKAAPALCIGIDMWVSGLGQGGVRLLQA